MTVPPDIDARLAEALPSDALEAALAAYHDALISGLCHDGAWEIALDARPAEPTPETPT